MSDLPVYDRNFAAYGLSASQRLVVEQVPPGSRVLDVGSAGGYVAEALRAISSCEVVCLDAAQASVDAARRRGFEARLVDLDRDPVDAAGFDVVVLADVLEHLRRPADVLAGLRGAPQAVVSIPNAGHWTFRRAVAAGRFPREDDGLFDRTHLQFFTRDTWAELVTSAGWEINEQRFVAAPLPLERLVSPLWHLQQRAATLRPTIFAYQFVSSMVLRSSQSSATA